MTNSEQSIGQTEVTAPKSTQVGLPKWEVAAKARISSALKKLAKPTALLLEKDVLKRTHATW